MMMKLRCIPYLLLLVISLVLVACGQPAVDLPFQSIEQRPMSGTGELYEDRQPGVIVISTADGVGKLEGLITPESLVQLQALDYQKHFAIAVFQGWKPTDGFNIQIERITRAGDQVSIIAQAKERQPDLARADVVTSPYHLVVVDKLGEWNKPVSFELKVNTSIAPDVR
jgi:hypothetical protein